MLRCWLIFVLTTSFAQGLIGQKGISLQINTLDKSPEFFEKILRKTFLLEDSLQVVAQLEKFLKELHQRSWVEASFDRIDWQDTVAVAWLRCGSAFRWLSLKNGNIPPHIWNNSGLKERWFQNKPLDFAQWRRWQERLLDHAADCGYPFAQVRLDSFSFAENALVCAGIFMDTGPLIFFDSLRAEGDIRVADHLLRQYLGIRRGEVFHAGRIKRIRQRLQMLPYLREKKDAAVRFRNDRADVLLFLEKRKAGRFDFLLGMLPDNARPGQPLLITGNFIAEFQNSFSYGERIFINFERLRPQTQRMEALLSWPWLPGLPLGLHARFSQYRRDSTFTDIIGEAGIRYMLESGYFTEIFWNPSASHLISVDTIVIRQGRFPAQLDVKNDAMGFAFQGQQLDYAFNPRRGWFLRLEGSAGIRRIRRNQSIITLAENFYDTLPVSSYRFLLKTNLERYWPFLQRSALKLAHRMGIIHSGEGVFLNEQFRIGGNRLMRGFDEESVFATLYSVLTVEYRLLLDTNSWLYLFTDYGYVKDSRYHQTVRNSALLGFGAGLTFDTPAGVLGLALAYGKNNAAAPDFRNPKIHLGYVSLF